jgi:hypothetical protein
MVQGTYPRGMSRPVGRSRSKYLRSSSSGPNAAVACNIWVRAPALVVAPFFVEPFHLYSESLADVGTGGRVPGQTFVFVAEIEHSVHQGMELDRDLIRISTPHRPRVSD